MSSQNRHLDQSGYSFIQAFSHENWPLKLSFGALLAYVTVSIALIYYLATLAFLIPHRLDIMQKVAVMSNALKSFLGLDGGIVMARVCQKKDTIRVYGTRSMMSDGLKRFVGLGGARILARVYPNTGAMELDTKRTVMCDAPPGLRNWSNTCYQNSVIQALASLPALSDYLEHSIVGSNSGASALREIMAALNDPMNAGRQFCVPNQLKSMSSWRQQDAQEYLSKVLEDVSLRCMLKWSCPKNEKARKDVVTRETPSEFYGVDSPVYAADNTMTQANEMTSSPMKQFPMEGMLAQRVGCMRCHYTEGLSLIPFNCLTVSLGSDWTYDIQDCLEVYTALETIEGVECVKCTLLKSKEHLEKLIYASSPSGHDMVTSDSSEPSQKLHTLARQRLKAVSASLDSDDFEERNLTEQCKISKTNRVTTTKSRQAVVARAPKSLVIHINRSIYDDFAGQRKNQAIVTFPELLNLDAWCLGANHCSRSELSATEEWSLDPGRSMLDDTYPPRAAGASDYGLRAVITHYGGHENGHYTCYRKHPAGFFSIDDAVPDKVLKDRWWRISDGHVEMASIEEVLAQGNVFMLFYERGEDSTPGSPPPQNTTVPAEANIKTEVKASTKTEASLENHVSLADEDFLSIIHTEEESPIERLERLSLLYNFPSPGGSPLSKDEDSTIGLSREQVYYGDATEPFCVRPLALRSS